MGDLYRRFWMPALLPVELPHADSDPIRFRILGEDLIAFRDTNGKVGFLAQQLPPPRRLALLRPQRGSRPALRLPRLEVRRRRPVHRHAQRASRVGLQGQGQGRGLPLGGVGRLRLDLHGPARKAAAAAELPLVHAARRRRAQTRKWMQESNYSQGVEGDLDSAHVSFLHRKFDRDERRVQLRRAEPDNDGDGLRLRLRRAAARSATSTSGASRRSPCPCT